jgi:hypothetical protein
MPRALITDGEIDSAAGFADNAKRFSRVEGIVVRFYPGVAGKSPACVDVQPGTNDVRFCVIPGVPAQPDGAPPLVVGQRYPEPWPVLHRVPIRYPSGNGRAIWWDLKPGDKVDLEAPDLDPSAYRASGQQSDPPMTRRNSGSFWTAIPGTTADPDALGPSGGLLCIGSTSGPSVTIGPSGVTLGVPVGGTATDAVARATAVDAVFQQLLAALLQAESLPAPAGTLATALVAAFTAAGYSAGTPGSIAPPVATVASSKLPCAP